MTSRRETSFNFRLEFPPELPISARAEEVVAAIQNHPVVILAGETGSGKTTQIPKMCLAAGRGVLGRIACTQPRRVAALSVSRRVAEELNVTWGREVGCKIRFNDQTTPATVIKFLTDGMLLAEVQGDPLLREYDTLIIDEAHERSLNIDFLLGHLRTLRYKRPELKIIITSATIDTTMFSAAFEGAPVIEVSGRTFPVEVIYAPLDELGSDAAEGDERESRAESLHYIDGAVEAVQRIIKESTGGDILVFMPSERDIRETCDLLDGRRLGGCELVPLFGRLSNAEQQRVFAPTQRRKIVVATNIAETSLTIPGIRFVVDTGLARISRYAPQTRTRRLPIEPVAQSSADQRKGRSGRVAEGVCIRLYSEKDVLERPRFTQPEIQRANLADVILRMKAFGLGDIERFPFINMPSAKAIRAGYALLEELGAVDERDHARELTPLGRELARLPVDPTIGRMILQARQERALQEVLVIAAGLSIQDPRERPLDQQAQADAAHRRFLHPDSDFLTLLNIWEAYHGEFETMTQSKLRKFCREHFLSYIRMREWRDIHAQLREVVVKEKSGQLSSAWHGLKVVDAKTTAFGTPGYRAIHRAILSGLLGNIAEWQDEGGFYKAPHDRKAALFPGSVLFKREEKRKPAPDASPRGAPKKSAKAPRWILAAEVMETSKLYARTCARLDPQWAVELGEHLLKISHSEPFWDEAKGRVMVKQRTRLHGLELQTRAVGFGRVDPAAATEIFIREGLVNDTITWPFDFLRHNREVRQQVENILTRTRDSGFLNLDEAVYRFYATRLLDDGGPVRLGDKGVGAVVPNRPDDATMRTRAVKDNRPCLGVSSVAELVDFVRERKATEPRFLEMQPEDLRESETLAADTTAYPETLPLANGVLALNYFYRPGQEDDGVTLEVNVRESAALTAAALDWAVPGHLEAKVEHYLRALPKELRRAFVPLAETARSVAEQVAQRDRLTDRRESLIEALAAQLNERFGLRLRPEVWADKSLPDHLRVRVRVVDDEGGELCASRDFTTIAAAMAARQAEVSTAVAREDPKAWRQVREQWERTDQTEWTFGDVPETVRVTEQAGVPVLAYPGLKAGTAGVSLRLCQSREEAQAMTRRGAAALLELQLRHDLGWLQRDLKDLRALGTLASTLAPIAQLQEDAAVMLRDWVCERPIAPLSAQRFETVLAQAKADLRGIVPRLGDLLREILTLRQELLMMTSAPDGLHEDVAELLPGDFLRRVPWPQLAHLPRYLRAMKLRVERWRQNSVKDATRARQAEVYRQAARALGGSAAGARLRWLVEEYRVSVFAQELGTVEPVSPVKLDRLIRALKSGATADAVSPEKSAGPVRVAPRLVEPSAPLKSLGALDKLFKR